MFFRSIYILIITCLGLAHTATANCDYGPDTCVQGELLFTKINCVNALIPSQATSGVKRIQTTTSASHPPPARRLLKTTLPRLAGDHPPVGHTAPIPAYKATFGAKLIQAITFVSLLMSARRQVMTIPKPFIAWNAIVAGVGRSAFSSGLVRLLSAMEVALLIGTLSGQPAQGVHAIVSGQGSA